MDTKICILLDSNNVIKSCGICLSENHIPLENGTIIETDLDLESIDLVDNYKLVNGEVVELTAEEKEILFPTPTPQPTATELIIQKLNEANMTISLQSGRIKQIETDAVEFQNFILETLGGN